MHRNNRRWIETTTIPALLDCKPKSSAVKGLFFLVQEHNVLYRVGSVTPHARSNSTGERGTHGG